MSTINWDRVETVMRRIFNDPKHHNQATWLSFDSSIIEAVRRAARDQQVISQAIVTAIDAEPECGTTACMAGWGALLFHDQWGYWSGEAVPTYSDGARRSWIDVGREVFGINQRTAESWFLDSIDKEGLLDRVNSTRALRGLPGWTEEFLATEPTNAPVR